MKETLWKAGIVGCGRIAGAKDFPFSEVPVNTHAQAYYQHPLFEVIAAAEPKEKALQMFQKTWGITRGYRSLTDMLSAETLDVLSLCSPSEFHAEHIAEIIMSPHRPKIIFAEKPVCLTRQEYINISQIAEINDCRIVVNHSRRFDPGHIRLREIVEQGEFGDFTQGWCHYYGGWYNNGCHMVDVLRMLLNVTPEIKSVEYGAKGKRDDICLNVTLLFGNSPVKIMSFDESYYQVFEMELRFTNGRVLIRDFGAEIILEIAETNVIGERVLVLHQESPLKGLNSPLYQAISLLSRNLKDNVSVEGCGILFNEVYDTMDILWGAKERLGEVS